MVEVACPRPRARGMKGYETVLITGASSGIGRALALALAAPGVALHLSGRNAERLEAAAEAARGRGADVHPRLLNVQDRGAMAEWVGGAGRLDLVVANAGVAHGTAGGMETEAQSREIFATNLDGALNTVRPALAAMLAQPPGPDGVRGRIAVIASMAIYVATPGAPAYAASKAALDVWTAATGVAARRQGVVMTSFCPGYVRTAMVARNSFGMPGLMSAEQAAAVILRGMRSGRPRVSFPVWMAASARLVGLLPANVLARLLHAAPGRAAVAYFQGPGS